MNIERGYRPDIDGLRAIAVAAVVAFHFFPGRLPGGFIGVDIFFVISGFLIGGIVARDLQNGQFSFGQFYARRINRIFPALLIVIAACLSFGWFALLPDEFASLAKHALASAAFVQNFALFNEAGYFDTVAELKPLLHLWSLGIEEQFYLVFPVAAWLAWRKPLVFLLVIASALSFILSLKTVRYNETAAFFLPHLRAWELLSGCLLAYFYRPPNKTASEACSLLGMLLLLVGVVLISRSRQFPGWWALFPVVGTLLVIYAGPAARLNKLLSLRAMVWVGLISYPLYLWHWPILSFARIIDPARVTLPVKLPLIALSVVLAVATYMILERPFRSRNHLKAKSIGLVFASLLIAIPAFGIYRSEGLPKRESIAYLTSFSEDIKWPFWTNDLCLKNFDFKDRKGGWWFCVTNSLEPTTILVGNSFANALYPGFATRAKVVNIGACDPAAGLYWGYEENDLSPCAGNRTDKEQAFLYDFIAKTPSLKTAILSTYFPDFDANGRWLNRDPAHPDYVITLTNDPSSKERTSFENYFKGLSDRITMLEQQGLSIILFLPKPNLGRDIKECIDRPFKKVKSECILDSAATLKSQEKVREGLARITKQHPSIKIFDQFPHLCDESTCRFIRDRVLLRDDTHYSEAGSRFISDRFFEWANRQVPPIKP